MKCSVFIRIIETKEGKSMKEKLLRRGYILFLSCFFMISLQGMVCDASEALKAPNPVKVTRQSNTTLKLKWTKVKKASGYIIYKYNRASKKYIKYKDIKNKNTLTFTDKIGSHTSAEYKVSAYKKNGRTKKIGRKSYWVRARTYQQGDNKVNAGKIVSRISRDSSDSSGLAYHETMKLSAKLKASTYSKAKGKTVSNKKVRWYTSNAAIATVDKKGLVKAQTKAGKCYIYARAHNGKKSKKITVHVKNYAKPKKSSLDLSDAWKRKDLYGFVLELFTNNYKTTTDIAEYFYINRPAGKEIFKCWMEKGEVKMLPENYVSKEMKQKIYNFVKSFPYDIRLDVSSDFVKFTELYGFSEEHKYAGAKAVFRYDQSKIDPSSYNSLNLMTPNWNYGYFTGI